MNRFVKVILFVLLIAYMASPVDLCPGPVDDLIMLLLYAAGSKALPSGND